MTDMTMTDATILASLLTELRLPSIARNWKRITEAANREGWPAQKNPRHAAGDRSRRARLTTHPASS
jgi:hypothetical protein